MGDPDRPGVSVGPSSPMLQLKQRSVRRSRLSHNVFASRATALHIQRFRCNRCPGLRLNDRVCRAPLALPRGRAIDCASRPASVSPYRAANADRQSQPVTARRVRLHAFDIRHLIRGPCSLVTWHALGLSQSDRDDPQPAASSVSSTNVRGRFFPANARDPSGCFDDPAKDIERHDCVRREEESKACRPSERAADGRASALGTRRFCQTKLSA